MKKIWITGASGGIGAACVKAYVSKGYFVILSARNASKMEEVVKQSAQPDNCALLPFDMTSEDAIRDAVGICLQKYGCPDIVLLNAGVSQRSLAIDTQLKVSKDLMQINYYANVLMTTLLLPHLITIKGQIAVMSSLAGKVGAPYRSSYAAAKHALHGYYDSLRAEVYSTGVSITLLCPGYIKTDISKNALEGDGHAHNIMDPNTGKGMEPEVLALKIFKAIDKRKAEAVFGGFETNAVLIQRFLPSLMRRILRKVKP